MTYGFRINLSRKTPFGNFYRYLLIRQIKRKRTTLSQFRANFNTATETFYNTLANRKPQSGTLHKVIQFFKTSKDLRKFLFRNSTARIADKQFQPVSLLLQSQCDTSRFSILNGIG